MEIAYNKWKFLLLFVILILGALIFFQMITYLSGFLGAFTIYVMVRGQMRKLTKRKRVNKSLAASLILVEVFLCFIIPITAVVWLLISKLQEVNLDPQIILNEVQASVDTIHAKTGYNLLEPSNISKITSKASVILQIALDSISSFTVNALIMLFVLYFLLIGGKDMEAYITDLLPFRKDIKKDILKEAKTITFSNAVGIPLLAAIQGVVAFAGYLVFGVPNALVLAVLTCFSTILPIVGTTIVWLPAAIYLAITGHWLGAIGLAIYGGLAIGGSDNLVRFLLQKKLANTHPLITIFGVIIGLSLFGFWGVIFGPLLLSLFCLCVSIYKREYIDKENE